MSANNTIKKFCSTKHFVAGLSIGLALLAITIPMMMPFIIGNADAIQDNSIDITKISSDVSHIDTSLTKLDSSIAKLDEKLDKFNLILCDISSGIHC